MDSMLKSKINPLTTMTIDQKIEALTSKYQALSERLDAIASRMESPASALAKLSHRVPTEKRQANSRANGAKGGRPKKSPPSDS